MFRFLFYLAEIEPPSFLNGCFPGSVIILYSRFTFFFLFVGSSSFFFFLVVRCWLATEKGASPYLPSSHFHLSCFFFFVCVCSLFYVFCFLLSYVEAILFFFFILLPCCYYYLFFFFSQFFFFSFLYFYVSFIAFFFLYFFFFGCVCLICLNTLSFDFFCVALFRLVFPSFYFLYFFIIFIFLHFLLHIYIVCVCLPLRLVNTLRHVSFLSLFFFFVLFLRLQQNRGRIRAWSEALFLSSQVFCSCYSWLHSHLHSVFPCQNVRESSFFFLSFKEKKSRISRRESIYGNWALRFFKKFFFFFLYSVKRR